VPADPKRAGPVDGDVGAVFTDPPLRVMVRVVVLPAGGE